MTRPTRSARSSASGPASTSRARTTRIREGDITGKISLERDAVEAHGGHIHFTDEVTFSSTELINRHLNVFEPHIREHLDTACARTAGSTS